MEVSPRQYLAKQCCLLWVSPEWLKMWFLLGLQCFSVAAAITGQPARIAALPAGIANTQWSKNRFCSPLGATHYCDKWKNLARGSGPQSLVPNLIAAKLSDIMLRRVWLVFDDCHCYRHITLIILFLVSHFNFLFIPCGKLSWLPVSFLLHVKYTLSYRIQYSFIVVNVALLAARWYLTCCWDSFVIETVRCTSTGSKSLSIDTGGMLILFFSL